MKAAKFTCQDTKHLENLEQALKSVYDFGPKIIIVADDKELTVSNLLRIYSPFVSRCCESSVVVDVPTIILPEIKAESIKLLELLLKEGALQLSAGQLSSLIDAAKRLQINLDDTKMRKLKVSIESHWDNVCDGVSSSDTKSNLDKHKIEKSDNECIQVAPFSIMDPKIENVCYSNNNIAYQEEYSEIRPASQFSTNKHNKIEDDCCVNDEAEMHSMAIVDHKLSLVTTFSVSNLHSGLLVNHQEYSPFSKKITGLFKEPFDIAVTVDNEILVVDSALRAIYIVNTEGILRIFACQTNNFPFSPVKVAVMANSGNVVVLDSLPNRQVHLFDKEGIFLRKFGNNILEYPLSITTDSKDRIIVVESFNGNVVIFDAMGIVLNTFNCHYIQLSRGVAVNKSMEIFIVDHKRHCIKVFDYHGNYMRQIGCEGITNSPIGVVLTESGNIAIANYLKTFNLVVFNQSGLLLRSLKSDEMGGYIGMALMKDGSLVMGSKGEDSTCTISRFAMIPDLCY